MVHALAQLLSATREFLGGRDDAVVADFLAGFGWPMPARPLAAATLPCLMHLDRAAAISPGACGSLARGVAALREALCWRQTYGAADMPRAFLDAYGWIEIFGTRGHFAAEAMAGGFLLLGPGTEYPDHHHAAEEIYVPLTGGTLWRRGGAPFAPRAAGEVVHHPPGVSHAMRTGAEPLLALYLWRGGALDEKSTFGVAGSDPAG